MQSHPDRIILSADAMRRADRRTIDEFGLASFTLMETAARGVADEIERRMADLAERAVLVLAGPGNNGGDGLAVARLLFQRGADVFVLYHSGAEGASAETQLNLELLRRIPESEERMLTLHRWDAAADLQTQIDTARGAMAPWGPFDLAVDALLGIGVTGALREPIASMAEFALSARSIAAIDVPTGLDTDTGERQGAGGMHADFTVTMAATKPCHWFGAGPKSCGDVTVVDIGLPAHLMEAAMQEPGSARVAGAATVARFLRSASRGEHKFAVGQAAVVAGSNRYSGALILASKAAARVGAGYVVCASTERAAAALDAQLPEVVALSFRATESGTLPAAAAAPILAEFGSCRACLVGPGLGYAKDDGARDEIRGLVGQLVREMQAPLVIDADGLNALDRPEALRAVLERQGATVLTPHPGEFGRLVEASGQRVPTDPAHDRPTWLASTWARRFGVVLVLKGSPTVIAGPDGTTFVAPDTSRALATAGSGDVLAGMITGLIAQGLDPLEAAVAAVHLGLDAATDYAAEHSAASCQATDLIERIATALHRY
ncbi:Bifunctional NAD(P)H-hydrate repair enzyme Nnr [Planctomycetes bacterium Poly30]|uniref:Bifunctional NAD(P)H-hydrate repair enzyme n=1 Tax=Saltatorellus ferox TaxID=2528018 RepID=A0A518F114_9BACT|nr:Bifunctional NAD(P)H-hydrate repair enzyme Nnr [Planctomycetes bacterium Poly30]